MHPTPLIYYGPAVVNKLSVTTLFPPRAYSFWLTHPAALARLHSECRPPASMLASSGHQLRSPPRALPPASACTHARQPPPASAHAPTRPPTRQPPCARPPAPDSRSKFMHPKSLFVRNYPNIHFNFIMKYCY
jgi:hypothetical protein